MTADRPFIHTTPGVRFGRPNLRGVSVEAITGMVLAEKDVAAVGDEYNLNRGEVLVACWYAAMYGEPRLRRLWGVWAGEVYGQLAAAMPVDYDAVPDPPLDAEPVPDLTRRELDVLALLGSERTYAAIGRDLGVSVNTVNSHVRHLCRKLGARGRAQAVARGHELGILGGGR